MTKRGTPEADLQRAVVQALRFALPRTAIIHHCANEVTEVGPRGARRQAILVGMGVHAGFEYYGEYGPLHQILPSDQRVHALYAVMDVEKKDFDVNFGIGHGSSENPDKWVAKAIIAFPFK